MIKLENVEKIFPSGDEVVVALDNISLEIPDNTFTAIMGKSGSGKSTLLHLIAGLDTPTSGHIIIDGISLNQLSEPELSQFRNRSMGFVFQQFMLLKDFSIVENVMLPYYILSGDKPKSIQKAQELLERFGLLSKSMRYPHEVSGGEAQRAAIARALINKPSLILADEPTGNLDEKNQQMVLDILEDMRKEHPFTLLLATHNSDFGRQAQQMMLLDFGHLKSFGPPPQTL